MVVRLSGSEFRYRWKHTESIATQHDDVIRLPGGDAWDLCVRDELDRVGTSSVFRDRDVVVVGFAVGWVVDDVFQDGAVADSTVDFGFTFGGEIDRLGVTTTFDVEDTSV